MGWAHALACSDPNPALTEALQARNLPLLKAGTQVYKLTVHKMYAMHVWFFSRARTGAPATDLQRRVWSGCCKAGELGAMQQV